MTIESECRQKVIEARGCFVPKIDLREIANTFFARLEFGGNRKKEKNLLLCDLLFEIFFFFYLFRSQKSLKHLRNSIKIAKV